MLRVVAWEACRAARSDVVTGGHEHWRHGETRLFKMILELSHEMEITHSRKSPAKWRPPQIPFSFDMQVCANGWT